jgi:hypothetical protein
MMQPDLTIRNESRTVDVYNRGSHYSLEHYENGTWRQVRIAKTLDEAKVMAERYVGPSSPTLLNENV